MSLLLGDNFSKSWAEFVPHTLSAFRRRSLFFLRRLYLRVEMYLCYLGQINKQAPGELYLLKSQITL